MFSINRLSTLVPLLALMMLATNPAVTQANPAVIEAGKMVSFTYILSADGEMLEDNSGQEPLAYIQGANQILPALEAELTGLSAGEKRVVNLAAADAYGEASPDRILEVPLDQVPESSRVVGTLLQSPSIPGPIRVVEIREEVVVLDANHPLAGKDLTFDITIIAVEDVPMPSEDELAPPTN